MLFQLSRTERIVKFKETKGRKEILAIQTPLFLEQIPYDFAKIQGYLDEFPVCIFKPGRPAPNHSWPLANALGYVVKSVKAPLGEKKSKGYKQRRNYVGKVGI